MKYKYRVVKTYLIALEDTANDIGKRGGRVVSCFTDPDSRAAMVETIMLLVEYPA